MTISIDYSRKGQIAIRDAVDLDLMAAAKVAAGN